jgi:hypothetical protein
VTFERVGQQISRLKLDEIATVTKKSNSRISGRLDDHLAAHAAWSASRVFPL